jgi:hypothetical protein
MKTCVSGGIASQFLISGLDGNELSASHTGRFTPRDRRLVGPQSWSGRYENRTSAYQLILRRYAD